MTQPIRLVLPDLFQDRLAKLTEHAAHVDMIIGAVAQHGLRVAPVAQWLQRQPVRVLEPVDRALDASEQRRLIRDCPCPRASSLRAHRATLRHGPVGIHWISHTVVVTQQHCMSRLSRVFDTPASSAASACVPSIARVPEGARHPMRWTRSRAPAWASSEVASLRPRGTRAAGPWGRPWPPPECAPRGHSGQRRACVDPPARRADPRVPGFQFARSPPAPSLPSSGCAQPR